MSPQPKSPKYLYCVAAPRRSGDRTETRRYIVVGFDGWSAVMDRRYVIRQDDRWVEPDKPQIDDTFRAYMVRDSDVLKFTYGDKSFVRKPLPSWPKRRPEPNPKPEPETKPYSDQRSYQQRLDDLCRKLGVDVAPGVHVVPSYFAYFGFHTLPTGDDFAKAYRTASLRLHPDHGGDAMEFRTMQGKADKCREWFAAAGGDQ